MRERYESRVTGRAFEPPRQKVGPTARNRQLEETLREVWRWTTFDGVDVEALRKILLRADPDAALHAALDRLLPEVQQ